jgi:hypothetical protein
VDALQLFLVGRAGFRNRLDGLRDMSDDQWRQRPHGLNSVAWLVWHMARCEDVAINRFVVDRRQVGDEREWLAGLGIGRRDVGTGMTAEEVADLSERMDLAALRAYAAAVRERTDEVVGVVDPTTLDGVVDRERLRRVIAEEGVFAPAGAWVEERVFAGKQRGWFLLALGLTHNAAHWADVGIVRGLIGFPGR